MKNYIVKRLVEQTFIVKASSKTEVREFMKQNKNEPSVTSIKYEQVQELKNEINEKIV